MRRILSLVKAYFPHLGGVETIARRIAEGAARRGDAVTVLCFGEGPEREERNGVTILRIRPFLSVGSAPLSATYAAVFYRLLPQTEVVHLHVPNPAAELAWLAAPRSLRRPSLCTYQGDVRRPQLFAPAYRFLQRRFLRRCSVVVTSSPHLSVSSPVLRGLPCRVVPLGVRTERFALCRERHISPEVRQSVLGLSRPTAIFVGRLVYYKGIEVLLRALALVPGLSLLLVGEGPLQASLIDLACELGLLGRLRFVPPLPEDRYPELFALGDFLVLPSVHPVESFGLVVAEAMAAGLPVVTTNLGTGTSFVNRSGETGFVVPPGDVPALARTLRRLRDDPSLCRTLGERARERARCYFDEERMLADYLRLYDELCPSR